MATYYKYEKYQKYINGVPQDEYKRGNLIGTGEYSSLQDCEEGAIYKWIDSGETICDGYKLCVKEIKQKSTDGGNTWINTEETRSGPVIDMWSTECGVEILYRWNPTGITRCNGYNEEAKFVYQVSYTMGNSWEDVEPKQYKWEVIDVFTDGCFLATEPFTFTFDAGEEGGQLELNTTISTLYSYSAKQSPDGSDMYWFVEGISKYAIDWGEGEEVQIQTVTKQDFWVQDYDKPNPFATKAITNSIKLPNHTYRTGGVKTIKIWGNISYFGCKQVKDFIHWGYPMAKVYQDISSEDLLILLNNKGITITYPKIEEATDLPLIQAKIEGYDNFNKVQTTFTGTTFGTMYALTFKYLNYFDMSNSPNIVDPTTQSKFNQGRLQTFIADNCTSLQWTPDLHYLGKNDNSSKLTSISFKNCTNLKYVRPIEMYHVYVSGGVLTKGLNFTTGGSYRDGVFEGCLNIEEFDFGYDIYVDAIKFGPYTKLKKITGNLIMDGLIYHGQGQFYQFCKGLLELENIENLTLKGSCFDEAFMDCPKIKSLCTIIVWRSDPNGYAYLSNVYSNTGIVTLDISKIYQNETDPDYLLCDGMFENCLELTTVTNSLQVNQHVKSQWSFDSMFRGCSNLTTISPIFKDKTDLPSLNYMFKNCNIKTIPNDMFNSSYEGSENTPLEMFANNVNLTNYPVFNGLPMWKMPPFFFTGITWAHTFSGCPLIAADVPIEWGGLVGGEPAKFKVVIPRENFTYTYRNYTENNMSVITLKSDGGISTNGQLLFPNPGTYTLEVYYTGQNSFNVEIPSIATEILDWGNAKDIDPKTFTGYPNSNPVSDFNVTKLPYGKSLFSNYGTFNACLEGSYEDKTNWYKIKNITDVDDNILQNCGSVTKIGRKIQNSYRSVFNMNLSEQKYTAMLSYLTNLSEIHRLFDWNNEVIATFTTTCGIFKNNPGLTNIEEAFAYSKLKTIPVDEFSNNKELVNVSKVFLNSKELTNMPNFIENKKITKFNRAFDGCSKLTGSTPTDENGYKLWERAGKEGYPAEINGRYCFRGCTQLDDYNEIPSDWK